MDTIILASRNGSKVQMCIRTKQYNRLLNTDTGNRMDIIKKELHRAKYDMSDMFTRVQYIRAKERLGKDDFYNEVIL